MLMLSSLLCCCVQAIGLNPEYMGADLRSVEVELTLLSGRDVFIMPQQDYSVRLRECRLLL